jgi:hypothetical protein
MSTIQIPAPGTGGGGGGGGITTIDTGNTVFVDSVNGDDGTGAFGDQNLPFATVAAALAVAISGSVVLLRPGTYAEFGLNVPANVTVRGYGWESTRVGSNAATSSIFTLNIAGGAVHDLDIICPAGAGLAGLVHSGGTSNVTGLNFTGTGAAGSGDGIYKTGLGKLIGGGIRFETGGFNAGLRVDSGVLSLDDVHFPQSSGITLSALNVQGTGRFQGQGFNAGSNNIVDGVKLEGTGTAIVYSPNIFNVVNAVRIAADGVTFISTGGRFGAVTYTVLVDPLLTGTGTKVTTLATSLEPLFSFPPAAAQNTDFVLQFSQEPTTVREARHRIIGQDLALGFPEKGSSFISGKGADYGDGIKVVTSDSTATGATVGGNLTDVTTAAQSLDSSTFTFQGTAANHCIYFATQRRDGASNPLKHWGGRISTVAAAVGGSYVFEVWNGANWAEVGAMATSDAERYRYSSSYFIRANSEERITYGLDTDTTWATLTIDGVNAYWVRCRIATVATTVPTFERWWLEESSTQINDRGQRAATGLGQWRRTLVGAGNVFAGGGTTANGQATVGTGLGTWTHSLDNARLNGSGDTVSAQFVLPNSISTAHAIRIRVIFNYFQFNAAPTIEGRILGVERAGVLVADSAGGLTPVVRTEANTTSLTANAGQIISRVTTTTDPTKLQSEEFGPYSVRDLYAGDLVLFQFSMTADGGGGGAATDIQIWAIEVEGVAFQDGSPI